jgi:uncharacterized protein (DUF2461 family)
MKPTREALPLVPLLHAYAAPGLPSPGELQALPGLGPRFTAVMSASARFLFADFLDSASDDDLRGALERFYSAIVSPPLHLETVKRRAGFVRHAVVHLLRGRDPLPHRLEACLSPNGAYRVPGLGPAFWSAIVQGLFPNRYAGWTEVTRAGLDRLGLVRPAVGAGPAEVYAALLDAHVHIRAARPDLSAFHVDHFLSLMAVMSGRNPHEGASRLVACPVSTVVRRQRARMPLRQRLKEHGQALADAQQMLEAGLAARDGKHLGNALAIADPAGSARCPLDWGRHRETLTLWIGRLWESDDPYLHLAQWWRTDPLPGAGLWLPAAVLHLRDPQSFAVCADEQRQGHARLDDGVDAGDRPAERYRLLNEAVVWLREKHALHPLEVADVLAEVGSSGSGDAGRNVATPVRGEFRGFCGDTFAFLTELGHENSVSWLEKNRARYRFAVRGPLIELCRALASRYVEPILCKARGWPLDTEPRSGRALTSIHKNGFGRGLPYNSTLCIAFCRQGIRRAGAQLFVRLGPDGVRYGLRLASSAKQERARLRAAIERHGEALLGRLHDNGAQAACRFGLADVPSDHRAIEDADGLHAWASGRTMEASCSRAADDPLLAGEGLLGEIILTFDRLLPLYAAAVEEDGGAVFAVDRKSRRPVHEEFHHETLLGEDWLRHALELLSLKKQLILQGVPGTGKTHVARCLARQLTGGDDEAVRLVQFHPAYSYEEFVEGIKVKSVAIDGRHDVTYPVEEGLLCSFASRAAAAPSVPHVLIIDEINRGNLPRIFGELLYLLEYRGSAVELPYSRRAFRLPENLYVLATMNAADRSIAVVDQALRRRFSFLEMEPDPAVLSAWLNRHPPVAGPGFISRVLGLFERLNARLRSEVGPHARIGHSYFMVAGLDESRLRLVWWHHVRPLLEEQFTGQPGKAATYDSLLEGEQVKVRSRLEVAAR